MYTDTTMLIVVRILLTFYIIIGKCKFVSPLRNFDETSSGGSKRWGTRQGFFVSYSSKISSNPFGRTFENRKRSKHDRDTL